MPEPRTCFLNAVPLLFQAFSVSSLEIYSTIFNSPYILNLLRVHSLSCLVDSRIWLHLQDNLCTAALSAPEKKSELS